MARFVRDRDDPTAAELAIVVADAWQRRGVATVLLELLVLSAADRGIERFYGYVASSNDAARRLLTGIGARGEFRDGMWVADLRLPDSTSSVRGTPLYDALTAAAAGEVRFEPRQGPMTLLGRLWDRVSGWWRRPRRDR